MRGRSPAPPFRTAWRRGFDIEDGTDVVFRPAGLGLAGFGHGPTARDSRCAVGRRTSPGGRLAQLRASKSADSGVSAPNRGLTRTRPRPGIEAQGLLGADFAPLSIPAWAGEPAAGRTRHRVAADYPRVCGETGERNRRLHEGRGLSPRVRGNRFVRLLGRNQSGTIPACVGKPPRSFGPRSHRRDYPRVCEETPSVIIPRRGLGGAVVRPICEKPAPIVRVPARWRPASAGRGRSLAGRPQGACRRSDRAGPAHRPGWARRRPSGLCPRRQS